MKYSQTQTIDMLKPGKEPRLLICNQGFSKKHFTSHIPVKAIKLYWENVEKVCSEWFSTLAKSIFNKKSLSVS